MVFDLDTRQFPLVPNWENSFTIEYAYRTNIITSRYGREQRRALRGQPRKTARFSATPVRSDLRAIRRVLAKGHNAPVVIPDYSRWMLLAQTVALNTSTVFYEGTAADWAEVGYPVFLASRAARQVRRIELMDTPGEMGLSGLNTIAFPAGAKIHPGLVGYLEETVGLTLYTNTVGSMDVVVGIDPATEPAPEVPEAVDLFNGREVFSFRPNWLNDVSLEYEAIRDRIDYDRNRFAVFGPRPFSSNTVQATFLRRGSGFALDVLDFFMRQKGQQGEFYMGSGINDAPLREGITAGATSLRVIGRDFFEDYAGDSTRKAIVVRLRDGTQFRRVVSGIDTIDDDSRINVTEAFPASVALSDILMVSWFQVYRFATDTLILEWLTPEVMQCQMTFRTLEDLE